jgi:hypothetical protein
MDKYFGILYVLAKLDFQNMSIHTAPASFFPLCHLSNPLLHMITFVDIIGHSGPKREA